MDYKKTFGSLSINDFKQLAENWYLRLYNLKEYSVNNPENLKVKRLIAEMIERMLNVSRLYIKISQPIPRFKNATFPGGQALVGDRFEREMYIGKYESIIPVPNMKIDLKGIK